MNYSFQKGIVLSALAMLCHTSFAETPATPFAQKDVLISAQVEGTCQFVTGQGDRIQFNALTTGGPEATASTDVKFWCTKGTGYTLNLVPAAERALKKDGTSTEDIIAYDLELSAGDITGTGAGNAVGNQKTATLTATIAKGAYDNVAAGNYTDTAVLTLTP